MRCEGCNAVCPDRYPDLAENVEAIVGELRAKLAEVNWAKKFLVKKGVGMATDRLGDLAEADMKNELFHIWGKVNEILNGGNSKLWCSLMREGMQVRDIILANTADEVGEDDNFATVLALVWQRRNEILGLENEESRPAAAELRVIGKSAI